MMGILKQSVANAYKGGKNAERCFKNPQMNKNGILFKGETNFDFVRLPKLWQWSEVNTEGISTVIVPLTCDMFRTRMF